MAYNTELTASRKVAILQLVATNNGDLVDIHAMNEMRRLMLVSATTIKTGVKGRPPLAFTVTGAGRSFMALVERNAKRKAA
jgi:hypothetical protein